jgi:hypothetical protein
VKAFLFGDCLVGLILPLVAEALIEHQGQDVVLVVLPRGLSTKNLGGRGCIVAGLGACRCRGGDVTNPMAVIVVVEGGVVCDGVMAARLLYCPPSGERAMSGVWSRLSFAGVV